MSKRNDGQAHGKYTLEFKLEAVRLVLGGQAVPVAAVAVLALPVASLVFGAPSMGENAIQAACCTSEYDELSPALISQLQASLSLYGPDAVAITRTAFG